MNRSLYFLLSRYCVKLWLQREENIMKSKEKNTRDKNELYPIYEAIWRTIGLQRAPVREPNIFHFLFPHIIGLQLVLKIGSQGQGGLFSWCRQHLIRGSQILYDHINHHYKLQIGILKFNKFERWEGFLQKFHWSIMSQMKGRYKLWVELVFQNWLASGGHLKTYIHMHASGPLYLIAKLSLPWLESVTLCLTLIPNVKWYIPWIELTLKN
jgi:hypothetical protein